MPFYDLHCANCDTVFNIQASMSDKMEQRIVCPQCGATHMETIYKPINFHIKNSDPPACPNSHICGSGCHHMRD